MATESNDIFKSLKPLIPGTIGGLCNTYVGHPLDTIKVKVQNSYNVNTNSNNSMIVRIFKDISAESRAYKRFGLVRVLFRGSTLSALGMITENSALFALNKILLDYVNPDVKNRSVKERMLCGFASGLACSIVASPFETLKCNQQIYGNMSIKDHYKMLGNGNMYRGVTASIMRKSIYYTVFFTFYETYLNELLKMYYGGNIDRNNTTLFFNGLAGGLAGSSSWFLSYPFDLIKCNQQIAKNDVDSEFFNTVKRVYNSSNSIRAFYKGLTVTMIRAIPASFALLFGVELSNRYLFNETY